MAEAMTPPPAEKVAEPFTRPFIVKGPLVIGTYRVVDAKMQVVSLAFYDRKRAEGLCDHLNAAAPAPSVAKAASPIDSSQQATLNRAHDTLAEHPLAKVATIIVPPQATDEARDGFTPRFVIDYGDVDPLDLTHVAGLMLRRVIKAIEADQTIGQTSKLAITREILKAIKALPIDLGEEQKDGIAPRNGLPQNPKET